MILLEGVKVPPIAGMNPSDIAKLTVEKFESEKVKVAVFEDSFLPPSPENEELVRKLVKAVEERLITRKGFPALSDAQKTLIAFSSDIDVKDAVAKAERTEWETEHAFRISNPAKWRVAFKLSKEIRIRQLEENGVWVEGDAVVSFDSEIERDALIGEGAVIISSHVGAETSVGRGSVLLNSRIGKKCKILPYCYIEGLETEDEVTVGPFARIRPETKVGKGTKIGNFAEVKNSKIGANVKIQHFSYTGDATVEDEVNVGAGTVTCNWDGVRKNPTFIGKGAFIGSGTMLVAPVKIGQNAYTGAGSTITKDVPDWALAVERAELKIYPDWVKKKMQK